MHVRVPIRECPCMFKCMFVQGCGLNPGSVSFPLRGKARAFLGGVGRMEWGRVEKLSCEWFRPESERLFSAPQTWTAGVLSGTSRPPPHSQLMGHLHRRE